MKLREKAPEILLEAISVVFAVLLALAVNEWQQDRQNAELANLARQGVLEEIAANRAELQGNLDENQSMLDGLEKSLEKIRLEKHGEATVDFNVSLLTSSAWTTAQITQAIHYLGYEWLARVSKLYELQHLYERRQSDLVDYLATMGSVKNEDSEPMLVSIRNRFHVVMKLHRSLIEGYSAILAESTAGGDGRSNGQPKP